MILRRYQQARLLEQQGGTAGPEAAAGTAQEPRPTAGVSVSAEAGKPVQQNVAIRSPRYYRKRAVPKAGSGVSVGDVDPTLKSAFRLP